MRFSTPRNFLLKMTCEVFSWKRIFRVVPKVVPKGNLAIRIEQRVMRVSKFVGVSKSAKLVNPGRAVASLRLIDIYLLTFDNFETHVNFKVIQNFTHVEVLGSHS